MVTAEQSERVEVFPWDEFLAAGARVRVEAFRRTEWPSIGRDLGRVYHWILPDGLEPCWVEPGKAMLWQEQLVNRPVDGGYEAFGQNDWQPVLRPANNATLIANDLRKGLLLRPPDQVIVEQGTLVLAEELAEPVIYSFHCKRHGPNRYSFETWKGYRLHCLHYKEPIEEESPAEVATLASKFKYFCFLHHVGFNNDQSAQQHIRVELRRETNKKASHVSQDEMRMRKDAKRNPD